MSSSGRLLRVLKAQSLNKSLVVKVSIVAMLVRLAFFFAPLDLTWHKDVVLVTGLILSYWISSRYHVPLSVIYDEFEELSDLDLDIGLEAFEFRIIEACDFLLPRGMLCEFSENLDLMLLLDSFVLMDRLQVNSSIKNSLLAF